MIVKKGEGVIAGGGGWGPMPVFSNFYHMNIVNLNFPGGQNSLIPVRPAHA